MNQVTSIVPDKKYMLKDDLVPFLCHCFVPKPTQAERHCSAPTLGSLYLSGSGFCRVYN